MNADSYGTQDSGEFGTIPADQGFLDDMRDHFSGRAGAMGDGYIDVGAENLDLEIEETAIDNAPDNNDVDETKIPRGNSIAHHILFNKAVFFDIETGGEKCGIIQIPCECFQILNGEGERKGTFDEVYQSERIDITYGSFFGYFKRLSSVVTLLLSNV